MTQKKKPFENIVGKGENAGNQHFLLFPKCFLLYQRQKSLFELHLFCRFLMLWIWSGPIFLSFGKELMHLYDALQAYQAITVYMYVIKTESTKWMMYYNRLIHETHWSFGFQKIDQSRKVTRQNLLTEPTTISRQIGTTCKGLICQAFT